MTDWIAKILEAFHESNLTEEEFIEMIPTILNNEDDLK